MSVDKGKGYWAACTTPCDLTLTAPGATNLRQTSTSWKNASLTALREFT